MSWVFSLSARWHRVHPNLSWHSDVAGLTRAPSRCKNGRRQLSHTDRRIRHIAQRPPGMSFMCARTVSCRVKRRHQLTPPRPSLTEPHPAACPSSPPLPSRNHPLKQPPSQRQASHPCALPLAPCAHLVLHGRHIHLDASLRVQLVCIRWLRPAIKPDSNLPPSPGEVLAA